MATGPGAAFDPSDPLSRLALHVFCDVTPEIRELTSEQRCALHEFFHEVLAAGYKLYQVVPPLKAASIIQKKFSLMLDDHQTG